MADGQVSTDTETGCFTRPYGDVTRGHLEGHNEPFNSKRSDKFHVSESPMNPLRILNVPFPLPSLFPLLPAPMVLPTARGLVAASSSSNFSFPSTLSNSPSSQPSHSKNRCKSRACVPTRSAESQTLLGEPMQPTWRRKISPSSEGL